MQRATAPRTRTAKRLPRSGAACLLAAGAAWIGCAGAPTPKAHTEEPQITPAESSAPVFTSPARWHYHPSPPEAADAWIRLSDGSCALVAEGGQRWVVSPIKGSSAAKLKQAPAGPRAPQGAGSTPAVKEAPCTGRAQAASILAPEELTGVIRKATSSWLFISASGTLYESGTALGPFIRSIAPREPLAAVAGAGSMILGATLDGKLLRLEGEGWAPVTSMTARVVDLAAAEGGRALALAMPEALFTTEDGGTTWKPASAPQIGAQRVGLTETGELAAQGLTRSITWNPRQATPFASGSATINERRIDLDVGVLPAPSGAAVVYGRAIIDGDRYYEVDHREDADSGWTLSRGKLDGSIEPLLIPATDDCGSMRLGANGKQLVTACVRAMGDGIIARIRRSDDAGESWSEPVTLETPDTDAVSIAVAPDGSALITGVCKQTDTLGSCKPGAPLLLRPEDRRRMIAGASEAPGLGSAAALPTFSIDGRSAYFLGHRVKDERLALFVSHDGGETFSERPFTFGRDGRPEPDEPSVAGGDDDDEERREGFDMNEESSLSSGEDGTVGMVLIGDQGITYVTTDEDGRAFRASPPPAPGALIAGFGRRAVAISVAESEPSAESESLRFRESLDGGSSWTDLPSTRALTRDFFRNTPVVACGGGGCLFGETVARVGWAGQAEAPAEPALSALPTSEPKLRAPIVCELSASSRWTRIDNILGPAWGAPGMNEAMRGRSVWSVVTYDQQTSAVSAVSAMLPGDSAGSTPPSTPPAGGEGAARVSTRSFFGRAPKGSATVKTAVKVSRQMEGYAAARVRFTPDAKDGAKVGVPMRGVEVAWENWNDGVSGRVTLPDAGPFELGDIRTEAGDLYNASLLSVSLRGIFVQPHSPSSRSSTTFFLEPGGKVQRFEYPRWPARSLDNRAISIQSETVLADDQLLAVGMEPWSDRLPFSTLLIARRTSSAMGGPPGQPGLPPQAWTITETAVAPRKEDPTELLIDTNWAYSGRSIGVTALFADPKRSRGWATFQPFRGDGSLGPASPVATPFDLADQPRPCSTADRASTARLEASLFLRGEVAFPGTRHPVLISEAPPPSGTRAPTDAGRLIVLMTSGTVLHGTPSSPCVAAWEADPLSGAQSSSSSGGFAAVLPGDLTHSWLFRPAPEAPLTGRRAGASTGVLETNSTTGGPPRRAIEYRPMTCRLDPSAAIPEAAWSEPGATKQSPPR